MFATLRRACVTCCLVTSAVAFAPSAFAQASTPSNPPAATEPNAPGAAPVTGQPPVAKPPSATETPAVVVDGSEAETLLGKPVESSKGEALGRIVDVIVDRAGMMRAAVIDFGGFLGVGTRKIAVDWHVLHFPPNGDMNKLIADLPRNQLQAAPIFEEGKPIVIMGAAGAAASPPASAPVSPASPSTAPSAPSSPPTSPPSPSPAPSQPNTPPAPSPPSASTVGQPPQP